MIISYAEAAVDASKFGAVLDPIIKNIIYPLLQLAVAVALVVFVYGVIQMIIKGDDADARETSKKSILYGVIGMFIMLSAWGIVYLISNTVKQINEPVPIGGSQDINFLGVSN